MELQATTRRMQLHAHVPTEVRRELLEIARANDRSLAAEIRLALREHVRREQERTQGGVAV
jgi:predicted transcriptional regulator